MRKFMKFTTTLALLFAVALMGAQKTGVNPRRPIPVTPSETPAQTPLPMASAVRTLTATPATIQFTANNPGSAIAGNLSATVGWTFRGGVNGHTWTLSVYADSTTFTGCTTVPASAVGVSCSSASVTGTGGPTAACTSGGPFTLPTTAPGQQVASGNEGTSNADTYSVVLNYQFTDSWSYIANTCPLTITYTVNAP
jgi:hypothetical protein